MGQFSVLSKKHVNLASNCDFYNGTIVMKNGSILEKWVTLGGMGHTEKMAHSWKNGSHLEKWITIR